jgi:hypothetical protein
MLTTSTLHQWQIVKHPSLFSALVLVALLTGCDSGIDKDTEDYRRFLQIGQINASYYTESQTKKKYPLVKGSLMNLGNRKLEVVDLTMKFKDSTGNIIFEDHGYPVFVSAFSKPDNIQVLLPGQKIPFALKSINCPPTWQVGQVDVVITKIVLAKETTE